MFIRPIAAILLTPILGLSLSLTAFCAPIDDWDTLILAGSNAKFEGKYDAAIQSFTKAVSLAAKEKLPNKCLPISLCRLAEVELVNNKTKDADSHFDEITKLIKTQKEAKKLDPQVNFWAAALADAYQANHDKKAQEICLKHACYLKALIYGVSHRESTECLSKLANYFIDQDKIDQALKTLEFREAMVQKQLGKDPDRYGDTLNCLALSCEKEHKYSQAKQLELALIKLAERSKSALNTGLPAFYFLLEITALEQKKSQESKGYFDKALSAAQVVKRSRKEYIDKYMTMLPGVIWHNVTDDQLKIAETEYKHLLLIDKIVSPSPDLQYDVFLKLGDVLYAQDAKTNTANRLAEVVEDYEHCIKIAELPHSAYKSALTDLYSKTGSCQLSLHLFNQGNASYSKALDLEIDKNGFHAALLYFSWGVGLMTTKKDGNGLSKLDVAYKKSRNLSPEKRGTLLADLLQMLGSLARDNHDMTKAQKLFKQSATELELQKSLSGHINVPDYYHRL